MEKDRCFTKTNGGLRCRKIGRGKAVANEFRRNTSAIKSDKTPPNRAINGRDGICDSGLFKTLKNKKLSVTEKFVSVNKRKKEETPSTRSQPLTEGGMQWTAEGGREGNVS